MYKGTLIKLSAAFSAATLYTRKEWHDIFKVLKAKKTSNQGYSIWQSYHSNRRRNKEFSRQAKTKGVNHH